ncbi:transporter [Spirosoma montaniterrae]|uniref:Transporter n=2 Tax=Spirosoma montaniterrae TaxID=1178516 RepID=A0A1P9WY61_9BACT|nr:transporter [Spirosoma montaniterrae]
MTMQRLLFLRIGIIGSLLGATLTSLQAQNTPAAVSPGAGTTVPNPQKLGLQQSIDVALQNNLTIRQSQIQLQGSELQLRQSKLNRLPNVGGFASQNFSSGFNVNPVTNAFVERSILSNNFQLNSQVTLYNGMALQNTIRQNDLLRQSNQQALGATQNNVILTVVQNYLNVLTAQEQFVVAQRQAEVSRAQLDRTQRLVNAGSVAESNLFDIRAQIANDELAIVNAQNNIDVAKVALLQAMNVPINGVVGTFEVEPIPVPDPAFDNYGATTQQVYETAQGFLPDVKAADLRVQSDALGVKVARASLQPTLTLNAGVSTIYSNFGQQRRIADGTTIQIPQTIVFNGVPQQIFLTQDGFRTEDYTFTEQLRNNMNRSVALNLQIPIYNRSQVRNRIINATLQQQNSEVAAANARLQLRQQIETAYTNLRAGANRYRATQVQVEQLDLAFKAAESRFNAGALNSTDYNIAKTNLDRARASLVQAKYDYVFRTKILDFYQNKPLTF